MFLQPKNGWKQACTVKDLSSWHKLAPNAEYDCLRRSIILPTMKRPKKIFRFSAFSPFFLRICWLSTPDWISQGPICLFFRMWFRILSAFWEASFWATSASFAKHNTSASFSSVCLSWWSKAKTLGNINWHVGRRHNPISEGRAGHTWHRTFVPWHALAKSESAADENVNKKITWQLLPEF